MDTSEVLAKAAEYTEKFIDAAVPVVKQAFDVALLTVKIDALSYIAKILFIFIVAISIIWFVRSRYKSEWYANLQDESYRHFDKEDYGVLATVITTIASICAVITIAKLWDVWLWVKLLHPDLWLAHEAILKALEVVNK